VHVRVFKVLVRRLALQLRMVVFYEERLLVVERVSGGVKVLGADQVSVRQPQVGDLIWVRVDEHILVREVSTCGLVFSCWWREKGQGQFSKLV